MWQRFNVNKYSLFICIIVSEVISVVNHAKLNHSGIMLSHWTEEMAISTIVKEISSMLKLYDDTDPFKSPKLVVELAN